MRSSTTRSGRALGRRARAPRGRRPRRASRSRRGRGSARRPRRWWARRRRPARIRAHRHRRASRDHGRVAVGDKARADAVHQPVRGCHATVIALSSRRKTRRQASSGDPPAAAAGRSSRRSTVQGSILNRPRLAGVLGAAALALAAAAPGAAQASGHARDSVFTETNDAGGNALLAFERASDGSLQPSGRYSPAGSARARAWARRARWRSAATAGCCSRSMQDPTTSRREVARDPVSVAGVEVLEEGADAPGRGQLARHCSRKRSRSAHGLQVEGVASRVHHAAGASARERVRRAGSLRSSQPVLHEQPRRRRPDPADRVERGHRAQVVRAAEGRQQRGEAPGGGRQHCAADLVVHAHQRGALWTAPSEKPMTPRRLRVDLRAAGEEYIQTARRSSTTVWRSVSTSLARPVRMRRPPGRAHGASSSSDAMSWRRSRRASPRNCERFPSRPCWNTTAPGTARRPRGSTR